MSAIHSLENEQIYLEVTEFGAEWTQLLAFNREYNCLWTAKKDVWPRHAPILFPVIGKLQNGSYIWQNREYALSPHGFARDSNFTVVRKSSGAISFLLSSSDKTLETFPFSFSLEITYVLEGNALRSTYKIKNLDQKIRLPFSIGAHAAFSYEWIAPQKNWSEVYVEFDQAETPFQLLDNVGLIDPSLVSDFAIRDGRLDLASNIFEKDALILAPVKSHHISLSDGEGRKIQIEFEDAFAFGLWSKKVDEFICLEPWWGLPDFQRHNRELTAKAGILWLEPGEERSISWAVRFINENSGQR